MVRIQRRTVGEVLSGAEVFSGGVFFVGGACTALIAPAPASRHTVTKKTNRRVTPLVCQICRQHFAPRHLGEPEVCGSAYSPTVSPNAPGALSHWNSWRLRHPRQCWPRS